MVNLDPTNVNEKVNLGEDLIEDKLKKPTEACISDRRLGL